MFSVAEVARLRSPELWRVRLPPSSFCGCTLRSAGIACGASLVSELALCLAKGRQHLARGLSRVISRDDCLARGHAVDAGIKHFPHVPQGDSADGERRQRDFGGDLAEKVEAGEAVECFCSRRKGRP